MATCRVRCAGQAGFKLRPSIQLLRPNVYPVMALKPAGFRAIKRHPSDQTTVCMGGLARLFSHPLFAIGDQIAITEKRSRHTGMRCLFSISKCLHRAQEHRSPARCHSPTLFAPLAGCRVRYSDGHHKRQSLRSTMASTGLPRTRPLGLGLSRFGASHQSPRQRVRHSGAVTF